MSTLHPMSGAYRVGWHPLCLSMSNYWGPRGCVPSHEFMSSWYLMCGHKFMELMPLYTVQTRCGIRNEMTGTSTTLNGTCISTWSDVYLTPQSGPPRMDFHVNYGIGGVSPDLIFVPTPCLECVQASDINSCTDSYMYTFPNLMCFSYDQGDCVHSKVTWHLCLPYWPHVTWSTPYEPVTWAVAGHKFMYWCMYTF